MTEESYDLAVIGGGPGGYTAAIRASQLGMKTALIEKDRLGGVCLNWGCIPSKAILHSAELMEALTDSDRFGIHGNELTVDFAKVIKQSRSAADRLAKGVEFLLKKNRIKVIAGTASLSSPQELVVRGKNELKIRSPRIILATGSKEKSIPGLEIDGKSVITSNQALIRKELPKSVLIIGGGAIGVEFAYAYKSFGVETTVIEMMDRLLPEMDHELGRELERAFKKKKIRVLTGTRYKRNQSTKGKLTVSVEGKDGKESTLSPQMMLVAVGRTSALDDLGLEKLDIATNRGFVQVDDSYQTSCPGVYAIGDLIGPPLLAHAASAEGVAAVEMMLGYDRKPIRRGEIPACVYCQPEVASVGLTEKEARDTGQPVKVGKFQFRAAGKAVATEQIDGWVKVVAGEQGRVLGAQMIGKGVTELVAEIALAIQLGATVGQLGRTIHAHPTLSEALMEASLMAEGQGINS